MGAFTWQVLSPEYYPEKNDSNELFEDDPEYVDVEIETKKETNNQKKQ